MKQAEDRETKNSLYTILIFLGIPMLMVSILAPPVCIIGDKDMDSTYLIVWGGLCLLFAGYFFFKQLNRKKSPDRF
jgi:hypothetical protein